MTNRFSSDTLLNLFIKLKKDHLMQSVLEAPSITAPSQLHRCLTAFDLTLLGIGAIIGAGIFVLTGIAAATQAGPAIIFSYILAGVVCAFSALAYAELASSVGGCGGAYSYAYAGIGQFVAWIIGWDLLLEYGMDAATVSIGWAGYVQNALSGFGIALPQALVTDPFHGGIINLPAAFIILCLAFLLSVGTKQSAFINKIIVTIKLSVIALFIYIGMHHFNANNWHPFLPFGMQGIVNGAGLIFFAYIGFDSLSTAAEETKNPQRDLPMGIIASLSICTIIYILVAGVLTGIKYYPTLNVSSPVALALIETGHRYAGEIISIGAIAGLTTAILAMFFGLTRVMLAMSRDGMLPTKIAKIHLRSSTPRRLIWSMGILMALIAGLFPIAAIANLVNIGTLSAFIAVSISVVVLRYTKPHLPRPFKTPFSPFIPILGVLLSLYLMSSLPLMTWISFMIWTSIGLVIYFFYSRHNRTRVR
jgi:APA family basic amino acid/polyamine antiporter